MAGPKQKPLLSEFGIHHILESCRLLVIMDVCIQCKKYRLNYKDKLSNSPNLLITRGTTSQELNGQNVLICIRQNEGFSGAVFTAQSFQVGSSTAGAGVGGAACMTGQGQGHITITGANIFCKSKLAPTTSQVNNAPVTVAKGPLRVNHYASTVTGGTRTGFVIDYNQI